MISNNSDTKGARLLCMTDTLTHVQETRYKEQDHRKKQTDVHRRPSLALSFGDYIYVTR